jgi:hypothetical protein
MAYAEELVLKKEWIRSLLTAVDRINRIYMNSIDHFPDESGQIQSPPAN